MVRPVTYFSRLLKVSGARIDCVTIHAPVVVAGSVGSRALRAATIASTLSWVNPGRAKSTSGGAVFTFTRGVISKVLRVVVRSSSFGSRSGSLLESFNGLLTTTVGVFCCEFCDPPDWPDRELEPDPPDCCCCCLGSVTWVLYRLMIELILLLGFEPPASDCVTAACNWSAVPVTVCCDELLLLW